MGLNSNKIVNILSVLMVILGSCKNHDAGEERTKKVDTIRNAFDSTIVLRYMVEDVTERIESYHINEGYKIGWQTVYNDAGIAIDSSYYEEGGRLGRRLFFDNGSLKYEIEYRLSNQHLEFHQDSVPNRIKKYFENGVIDSVNSSFYELLKDSLITSELGDTLALSYYVLSPQFDSIEVFFGPYENVGNNSFTSVRPDVVRLKNSPYGVVVNLNMPIDTNYTHYGGEIGAYKLVKGEEHQYEGHTMMFYFSLID